MLDPYAQLMKAGKNVMPFQNKFFKHRIFDTVSNGSSPATAIRENLLTSTFNDSIDFDTDNSKDFPKTLQ